MQRNVTVIFPTEIEAAPFRRYGELCNIVIGGIGYAATAGATVKVLLQDPCIVILAGIAGAYRNSGLKKCDIVAVCSENVTDLGAIRGKEFIPLPQTGTDAADNYYTNNYCLSGSLPCVVSNTVVTAGTEYIPTHFQNAQIENMEGAAFFSVCSAFGTEYAEIRSISNYVGENRAEWRIAEAAEALAEALVSYIRTL